MKIAIPIWQDRVSPVMDVAGYLQVISSENGRVTDCTVIEMTHREPGQRARQVSELGVEVLICAAVSRALEFFLQRQGVQVIPRTCGGVEDVVRAYLSGNLENENLRMPGFGRQRNRMGRGSGRGRNRGRGGPGSWKKQDL